MGGWIKCGAAVAALLTAAAPALAEDVTIEWRQPASYRDAAMLRSLTVERLAGRDGPQVSLAIERLLSQPDRNGRTYFDLLGESRRGGGPRAEGVLSGAVSSGVEENPFRRKEKRCTERKDKTCVKEEEIELRCTRRVINLTADVRMVRTSDGRIVYSASKPYRQEHSWCGEQRPPATVEEVIATMIASASGEVANEITPRWMRRRIRFLESTKGLPKPLAKRFRTSMKLSQRDLSAACADWASIDAQSPTSPYIAFDLGLCAESRGEYDSALAYYRSASPRLGRNNDADKAIDRIEQHLIGMEDDARRGRRR